VTASSRAEDVRTVTGHLTTWPAQALADLLGVDCPDFAAGAPLPLGWHWLYLLEHPPQCDLARDGHPVHGFPAPPEPGLRRMFAGGSLEQLEPLHVDLAATRTTRVIETVTKHGRSGALIFVTVEHEVVQGTALRVRETQNIVYRERAPAAAPEVTPAAVRDVSGEPGAWSLPITPPFLFRFSALTYNAHRIHYDRDYARSVEGYPGLVTHGPLQALAMLECLRASPAVGACAPSRFDYRLLAPLFEHQGMVVRAEPAAREDGIRAWADVRDRAGRRTAYGTVAAG
jgi:3-methylfumaryl-CoA hydratase